MFVLVYTVFFKQCNSKMLYEAQVLSDLELQSMLSP